jgi:S1-C subfamily serine protease
MAEARWSEVDYDEAVRNIIENKELFMSNPEENNLLSSLSKAMADAVEIGGSGTVLLNARRRFPASGVLYEADLILTASHVIEREDDIPVVLADGSELTADLLGRDPGSDLAVLRLGSAVTSPAEFTPQDARVGQLVLALGRPTPEGIQASLGVVSAVAGPVHTRRGGLLERHIRTDAIPYPGFSGGPLIDSAGHVLGVNTSGLTRGASIAIPSGLALQIAQSLVEHGSVKRGYLGVRSQPVEIPQHQQDALGRQQASGLLLVGIERKSPAEEAGLMVGDILVGFAGAPVADPDELFTHLTGEVVGSPTVVEIVRAGTLENVTVTIGERK